MEKTSKPHILTVNKEHIELWECPNKIMNSVNEYLRVYDWASNNRLQFLYSPETIPAKVVQAIDLIELEKARIMQDERERMEQERNK